MSLIKGKKGLIMGVANDRSIAWGIAKKLSENGAELAFTYLGDALKKRVTPLAESVNSKFLLNCNVENKQDIVKTFEELKKKWGQLDFVVHETYLAEKAPKKLGGVQVVPIPGHEMIFNRLKLEENGIKNEHVEEELDSSDNEFQAKSL